MAEKRWRITTARLCLCPWDSRASWCTSSPLRRKRNSSAREWRKCWSLRPTGSSRAAGTSGRAAGAITKISLIPRKSDPRRKFCAKHWGGLDGCAGTARSRRIRLQNLRIAIARNGRFALSRAFPASDIFARAAMSYAPRRSARFFRRGSKRHCECWPACWRRDECARAWMRSRRSRTGKTAGCC